MKAQVSFGSQPQNRPQALSAQMAPAMTANVQIGKPKTAVRWAERSRAAADGSRYSSDGASTAPPAARFSPRLFTQQGTLEAPQPKKVPEPDLPAPAWPPG